MLAIQLYRKVISQTHHSFWLLLNNRRSEEWCGFANEVPPRFGEYCTWSIPPTVFGSCLIRIRSLNRFDENTSYFRLLIRAWTSGHAEAASSSGVLEFRKAREIRLTSRISFGVWGLSRRHSEDVDGCLSGSVPGWVGVGFVQAARYAARKRICNAGIKSARTAVGLNR